MFEPYVIGGIALLVSILGGIFKYRGHRIEVLEDEQEELHTAFETQKAKSDQLEEVNEIYTELTDHDATVERLLKRTRTSKSE